MHSNLDEILGISRKIPDLDSEDSMILSGGRDLYYDMCEKWRSRTPGLEIPELWYYPNIIYASERFWGMNLRNSHWQIRDWGI